MSAFARNLLVAVTIIALLKNVACRPVSNKTFEGLCKSTPHDDNLTYRMFVSFHDKGGEYPSFLSTNFSHDKVFPMKEEATQVEETELFQVAMSAKYRGGNLWVYIYGASKTHCLTINSNGAIQIEKWSGSRCTTEFRWVDRVNYSDAKGFATPKTLLYRWTKTTKKEPMRAMPLCARTAEGKYYVVALGKGVDGIAVNESCCNGDVFGMKECQNETIFERIEDKRYHLLSLQSHNHVGLLSRKLRQRECSKYDDEYAGIGKEIVIGKDLRKRIRRTRCD